VTTTFRLRDGAGTAITNLAAFNRVAFAISGPSSDFGALTPPVITPTAVGGGSSGVLTGPDGAGVFTYTTSATLPASATGTWRIGLEARRNVTVNGATVSEAAPNPVLDFSVDGTAVTARRAVVANEKCDDCHGTFSKDFSVHGNLRNRVEYCVVCHNPNVTDVARRKSAVAGGADPATAAIDLKHLIHKIHRGEELEQQPYLVYGFGAAPKNYTALNFGEVRFPGDLRDCETCHLAGTQTLPLPAGVLPTIESVVNGGAEDVVGSIPPVTDACTSCHDSAMVAAHAETNTTASGAEACSVCHGEGSVVAVSVVHAPPP
jgi:OmcA/MtrC family decaheme c-type cytochrome